MSGWLASLAGALLLGALNTLGDFVWASLSLPHRALFGLIHGAVLCLALGLFLGVRRRRPARGGLGGTLVGLAAAGSFYALAPVLGYHAMFVSWMALWIGFALLDARLLRGLAVNGEALIRGLLAAIGSGLVFYAISDIWLRPAPGGPRYAYHFFCWTVAFLPGFLALLLVRRVPTTGPSGTVAATALVTLLIAADLRAQIPAAPYAGTPPDVVEAMLQLAELRQGDVVYDLGCGDGRIVIAAVRRPGVRAVCVELDPGRLRWARDAADQAGVSSLIRFIQGDLFEVPIQEATVVTLYLMRPANLRLRPRLLRELRPGARVVSSTFDMGNWEAERTQQVGTPARTIYRWTIPAPGPVR
jgi:methyltransferase family protein